MEFNIKTEPGGGVMFGELDSDQVKLLIESLDSKILNEELKDLKYNSFGSLDEANGVVNNGEEGDFGNEGTIVFCEYTSRLGPQGNENGVGFRDGLYVSILKLSKCSVEFEFTPDDKFDSDKFEEISVPVIMPKEIKHERYGNPKFNIVRGYKYDGKELEEEYEIIDRGYDIQFSIFAIKNNETTIFYNNYNEEEEWNNSSQALEILDSLKNMEWKTEDENNNLNPFL